MVVPPKLTRFALFAIVFSSTIASGVSAQYYSRETEDVKLVYVGKLQDYLVPQIVRSFQNSLEFHEAFFDYKPSERISVLTHDLWHYGNAGARPVPHNNITVGIAPYAMLYDASPGNERMNSSMNHEMVHLVTTDKATTSDRFFRHLFFGKVNPTPEQPASMLYSYLTTPRWYSPRWYLEGIAVYMETWMNGGLGRAIGAYDEMVFRTMVRDSAYIYDVVGLESEGTTVDFQVGVNSYLYGTRFVCYLAYTYGNDKLIEWYNRDNGSRRYFSSQFRNVFGVSLEHAWADWIAWEKDFQSANLARIREQPVTAFRPISRRALGSVSRPYLDRASGTMYVAIRYPGQVAHIAALDMNSGRLKRLVDVSGPSGFTVTSLAFNQADQKLFYTTDNRNWRNLVELDIRTGRTKLLARDIRTGDLVFNAADESLWGVRHYNGLSTIVRIPKPWTDWQQVYTLPYGIDMFDLDLSPDGSTLIASSADPTGSQQLVTMNTADLLAGSESHDVLFDFGKWAPANFAYSPDGQYIFGTSYYSGVSNVYRYDVEQDAMEPLSNVESGFFRPVPVSDDSLFVFRFTGRGFLPSMIPNEVPDAVSAIHLLGNEIARKEPIVKSWAVGSPRRFDVDSMTTGTGRYVPIRNLRLDSIYPTVEGYKGVATVGLRADFSDQLVFSRLRMTASYSPAPGVPEIERWHAGLRLSYLNLSIDAAHNRADFYDLFGPTKTSRKGNSVAIRYKSNIVFNEPQVLDYTLQVAGYSNLETLPEFQNVAASFSELLTGSTGLNYEFLRKSLGAVEDELGVRASITARSNLVNGELFPRISGEIERGVLLPINHSSLWIRAAAGQSMAQERDDPFARFFFGGFGNNWVDHLGVKRFRDYESFPGVQINEIGGYNFGRVQGEWVLPPLRFRSVGVPSLYLRWASLSLFATGIVTDFGRDDERRRIGSVGAQLDLRLVTVSHLNSTISAGYAVASEIDGETTDEWMVSLKLF